MSKKKTETEATEDKKEHFAMGWHKAADGTFHVFTFKYNDKGETTLVEDKDFGTFRAKAILYFNKYLFKNDLTP